jgi:hypothetical protein
MPEAVPPPAGASPLDALRERGVDRRDPVRFRLVEALARRAATHAGAARRVLDARVAALADALAGSGEAPVRPVAGPAPPGPLARLVAQAVQARPAAPPPGPRDAAVDGRAVGRATDPTTLQFFKRTWSRLSATQRLAQSRAALPENAGPLNSQHLVHRALTLMQALSPEYLERFVAHVDALQWLEQADTAAAQERASATRPSAARRSLPARR